ncbi:LysM peptidoglycan-binding domain-containing protein, partial [Haliangium sp. UPWRP_2]|uniref:LysM peptidoglycan-binding domain-containing protein n=1 Tax=Haliangium sp. UPWRP_2 TaxID=1931276 RepID=UPI000B5488C8
GDGASGELPADGLHSPPTAVPGPGRSLFGSETPSIPWLQALKLLDNLGLSPTFVRFESHVIRYLEFFKEERRGRSIMTSWLRKQGRYRQLIEQTLDKHGLPRFLLYVAMIESGYDPHDRSHKGAVGLWQFMPEGARIYGLRVDHWVDERKDPQRSTEAAARYLGDLKARFGSWHLALAAFNAGYGAVLRAMQKYNTNDYWELCRHEDGLPWETLNYVPKAIASALIGENRGFFGFDEVVPEPNMGFETVAIASPLSLDRIAHVVSSSAEELTRLNPELRRGRIPPLASGETWMLRVPPGTASHLAGQLDSLRRAEPLVARVVRFGERLEDIARDVGTSAANLKRLNGIEDLSDVRTGLTLLVPPGNGRGSSSSCAPSDEIIVVAVPDKTLQVPGKKRVFYRVIPGDSIWAIARFFKVKEADLLTWNALDPEATLATKMVLDLWIDPGFDISQVALVDPARVRVVTTGSDEFFELVETLRGRKRIFHVVKEGETWERLAKRYGLTVADLERINRTGRQNDLRAGQKVTVYLPMSASERSAALARLRGDAQPEPAEGSKADKTDKTDKSDKSDKSDKTDKSEGEKPAGSADRPLALPPPPPPDSSPEAAPDAPPDAPPEATPGQTAEPATEDGGPSSAGAGTKAPSAKATH